MMKAHWPRLTLRSGIILSILIVAPITAIMSTSTTYADTTFANDYPDSDATDCSAIYGIYSWCKGSPSNWLSGRGYGYRNCTDGVAYWVNKYTAVTLPTNLNDAKYWDNNAPSGYTVYAGTTNSIEPGDIAQSEDGSFGHVGFVTSVTKDTSGTVTSFSTAELNKGTTGEYSANTYNSRNASGNFIRSGSYDWDHFIDVNGANKGLYNETWPAPAGGPVVSSVIESGGVYHLFSGTSAGTVYETVWGTGHTLTTWPVATGVGTVTSISSYIDSTGGTYHVFSATSSGNVYETVWGTGYSSPTTWTVASGLGTLTSISSAVTSGNTYHVFSGNSAGMLRETYWSSGSPSTWSVATGVGTVASISSAIDSTGAYHLFSGNSGGSLYETVWGGSYTLTTWSVASSLGTVTSISSGIDSGGTKHIFSGTSAGTLRETYWGSGSPSTWSVATGVGTVASVSSAIESSGTYHIFSGNSAGSLYETLWGGGHTLTTWSVASSLGSITSISSGIDSNYHIFSGNSAGNLRETYWGSGSPSTWTVANL